MLVGTRGYQWCYLSDTGRPIHQNKLFLRLYWILVGNNSAANIPIKRAIIINQYPIQPHDLRALCSALLTIFTIPTSRTGEAQSGDFIELYLCKWWTHPLSPNLAAIADINMTKIPKQTPQSKPVVLSHQIFRQKIFASFPKPTKKHAKKPWEPIGTADITRNSKMA